MTPRDHRTIETAIRAIHRTTGLDARVPRARAGRDGGGGRTVLEFENGSRKYRFAAEVKTADRFETPAMVKAGRKDLRGRPLLVAPYITREMAERCRGLDLPFIDMAGNAYLKGPGLLIYVTGMPRPAELRQDRFRALNPA